MPARPLTLVGWLRDRTDRQLVELLRLRPDLALPAPPDVVALAARLAVRTSVQRAVDGLDAAALAALEQVVLDSEVDGDTIDSPDLDPDQLTALFSLALVWGSPDLVHLVPAVRESLGPYPGGLGRPAATLVRLTPGGRMSEAATLTDPVRLQALLTGLDDAEREIVEALAAGPPVGAVRHPGRDSAAVRLVERGLLVPLDAGRVELPREVALVVRQELGHGQVPAEAPEVTVRTRTPTELDASATAAVAEALRLIDELAATWSGHPPSLLRAGGVGVRELRRTARELAVDETTAAVVVEVAHAAGLVNATSGLEPVYLPTEEYDAWAGADTAARWTALATAWLGMTRQPGLVNQRDDRDRVINALGPDVERGTVPALRRQVLTTLATLPPGSSPDDRDQVLALLAWQQPRRARGQRASVEAILREADLLGVTAGGGPTGWTRTLLDSATASGVAPGRSAAAEQALRQALPAPVDHFLVQPDLSVVVPGPPDRLLSSELGLLADLESTGGASVYRIAAATVRRALDAGRTPEQLTVFLTQRSRTPLPQALEYLIADAARRHGVLRAGSAGSYLRCEDSALLSAVLADRVADQLGLRLLAPTVLVADVPVTRLLDGLRAAGFAPAAEGADGSLVTLRVDPARAPSRPPGRVVSARADGDGALAEAVRRMRVGDDVVQRGSRVTPIAAGVPGVTSAATLELLRRAISQGSTVQLGVAEPDGRSTAHLIQPYSLAAGSLRGQERGRDGLASYPVHRITSVQLVDEDADE